jgi:hypothetical protein
MDLRSVLLPAPFPPRRATISPEATDMVTADRTLTSP